MHNPLMGKRWDAWKAKNLDATMREVRDAKGRPVHLMPRRPALRVVVDMIRKHGGKVVAGILAVAGLVEASRTFIGWPP